MIESFKVSRQKLKPSNRQTVTEIFEMDNMVKMDKMDRKKIGKGPR